MKLETVKIKICTDSLDQYHIDCPNCDMWESLGIDDPRHMLNALPLIEWVEEGEGAEVSIHECSECEARFNVQWDYTNIKDEHI
tara:strand:- start:836 stop:1087 length:252 start_codon:yes stop_codon:yes gene_type:complete